MAAARALAFALPRRRRSSPPPPSLGGPLQLPLHAGPLAPPPLGGRPALAAALLGGTRALLGPRLRLLPATIPLAALGLHRLSTGASVQPGRDGGDDVAKRAASDITRAGATEGYHDKDDADSNKSGTKLSGEIRGRDEVPAAPKAASVYVLEESVASYLGARSGLAAALHAPRSQHLLLGARFSTLRLLQPTPLAPLGQLRFSTRTPTNQRDGDGGSDDDAVVTNASKRGTGDKEEKKHSAAKIPRVDDDHVESTKPEAKEEVKKHPAAEVPRVDGEHVESTKSKPDDKEEKKQAAAEVPRVNAKHVESTKPKPAATGSSDDVLNGRSSDGKGDKIKGGAVEIPDNSLAETRTSAAGSNSEDAPLPSDGDMTKGGNSDKALLSSSYGEGRKTKAGGAEIDEVSGESTGNAKAPCDFEKIQRMIDRSLDEQSKKQRIAQRTGHIALTLVIAVVMLVELDIFGIVAVWYGVSYAVKQGHEHMMQLAKDKKTEEMTHTMIWYVFTFFYKNGAVVVRKGADAVKDGAAAGASAVGRGASAVRRGAATAWDAVAFWRRWGKIEEVEEEDDDDERQFY